MSGDGTGTERADAPTSGPVPFVPSGTPPGGDDARPQIAEQAVEILARAQQHADRLVAQAEEHANRVRLSADTETKRLLNDAREDAGRLSNETATKRAEIERFHSGAQRAAREAELHRAEA